MESINQRTDWQWFEIFGEKCQICRGIKNIPNPHPNYLQECVCSQIPIAGTQPPKF